MASKMLLPLAISALIACIASGQETYWVTEFNADRDIEGYCEFGAPGSYMVLYKVYADTCHRVLEGDLALDKIVEVQKTEAPDKVNSLDYCDRACINCNLILPEVDINQCFASLDASHIIRKDFCIGSPELEEANSVAFAFYPSRDCDHESHIPDSGIVFVRNYHNRASNGCERDYLLGDVEKWYSMNITTVDGVTSYKGSFQCPNSQCTECEYVINEYTETEKCFNTQNGKAMKIIANNKLSTCGSPNVTDTAESPVFLVQ